MARAVCSPAPLKHRLMDTQGGFEQIKTARWCTMFWLLVRLLLVRISEACEKNKITELRPRSVFWNQNMWASGVCFACHTGARLNFPAPPRRTLFFENSVLNLPGTRMQGVSPPHLTSIFSKVLTRGFWRSFRGVFLVGFQTPTRKWSAGSENRAHRGPQEPYRFVMSTWKR
jgi:hypothetical protein